LPFPFNGHAVKRIDTRYALWGTALLLLAVLPVFAGFVGAGWEFCQMAGLLGCIACLALCGAPLRPRDAVPPTLLSLRLHRLIGWFALSAVVIHVGGLVLADRVVIEYLKLSAPLYQLAGIAAGVILLLVVVSSVGAIRQRLWQNHRAFQSTHVILGCVLIALITVHVIATDRYVGGRGRRLLILAAAIGAILMLLRPRRPSGAPATAAPLRQLVFGRNSKWIFGVATILAMALTGLIAGAAGTALREPLLRHSANELSPRSVPVPLDFPHAKHVGVNCLTCHHNFADGRGMDTCVNCHRSSRADLKLGVQARFHTFCFECHRHPDATLTEHGPVAGCLSCHHTPNGAP
jgi:predicted CXXCH cytochrome family protein